MSLESAAGLPIEGIVITDELDSRPSRPPDHAAESKALVRLARTMTESPRQVLQELADAALELCGADSAGISLVEGEGADCVFRWEATAGVFAPLVGGTMPRGFSPCGTVLDRDAPLLMADPARYFGYINSIGTAIREALLVPFHRGGVAVGTVWAILHADSDHFDAEDLRLLTSLGDFASAAFQVLDSLEDARRAEAARRQSEDFLAVAAEAGRTGSWYLRLDTMECVLTPMMAELMDFPEGQATASVETWRSRVVPEDRRGMELALAAAIQGGKAFELEFRIALRDGSQRWLYSRGGVVRDDAGRPIRLHGASVDITPRKESERERDEILESLREADSRKDQFLAMLAHELRNPIGAISSGIQLARLQPEHFPQVADLIQRQVGHLTRLIDDLLDVSRITVGKISLRKETVTLADVITRARELAEPIAAAKCHTLSVALPDHPVRFVADPTRIGQILGNLLINAAKYSEPGGRIELNACREGDDVVFRVSDTGIGISAEMLPKVFGLFTQVDGTHDRAQGGLGIGLTLVESLVALHGGSVEAASEGKGRGSTFIVRLPIGDPEAEPRPKELPRGTKGTGRVLVVDDSLDTARLTSRMLQHSGYEVEMAHEGREAIARAGTFRPDVILLDIGLPGMDGYDVARSLRDSGSFRTALIIAVSGYGEEKSRLRAIEAGFDHHLTKPVDFKELLELMAQRA